jgi:hypothetical protein
MSASYQNLKKSRNSGRFCNSPPTGAQAPWQNGTAERWIGSCRREMLDHVIALNERHLRRLIGDYIRYHKYAS